MGSCCTLSYTTYNASASIACKLNLSPSLHWHPLPQPNNPSPSLHPHPLSAHANPPLSRARTPLPQPNSDLSSSRAFKLGHSRPGTVSLSLSENDEDPTTRDKQGYR